MKWIKLNSNTFKDMIAAHKSSKCVLLASHIIDSIWCYDVYQTNVFNIQYLISSNKYYYMIIDNPK